jgi:hypothetical protein
MVFLADLLPVSEFPKLHSGKRKVLDLCNLIAKCSSCKDIQSFHQIVDNNRRELHVYRSLPTVPWVEFVGFLVRFEE